MCTCSPESQNNGGQQVEGGESASPLWWGLNLQYHVQLCSPQHNDDMGLLERDQRRPQKWPEGWNMSSMEKGWELGLLSLDKRKLKGDPIAAFQYLKWAYKKDGDSLHSRAFCDFIYLLNCHHLKIRKGPFEKSPNATKRKNQSINTLTFRAQIC